jgi:hypothetical protein
MNTSLLGALCLAMAMAALPVRAEVFPVDDSASQVLQAGPVKMRWDSMAPTPGQPATISGELTVLVRLDVSPWQGRAARIYQRLAPVASGPVTATWTANGPLLPGKVQDGGRTLVYSGVVASARLEDTFRIHIQANGERVQRPQDLVFTFEIELEAP